MKFRIALVGTRDSIQPWLSDVLRSDDFSVELCDLSLAAAIFGPQLHMYDTVIVSADLAADLEEDAMFTSLLDAQGFLIFDDQTKQREVTPSFLIHAGMSPEEILARINNVLYMNKSIRKSPRIRINLAVEYEYAGKRYQSTMQDLSENGAFIMTLAPPPRDVNITVRFTLPNTSHEIAAIGRAVFNIGYNLDQSIIAHPSSRNKKIIAMPGFGLTFNEMTDVDRETVRGFLMKNK